MSIEAALFDNDELAACELRLGIDNDLEGELAYPDRDFRKAFKPPPRWWHYCDLEDMERTMQHTLQEHLDCKTALDYARYNPVRSGYL